MRGESYLQSKELLLRDFISQLHYWCFCISFCFSCFKELYRNRWCACWSIDLWQFANVLAPFSTTMDISPNYSIFSSEHYSAVKPLKYKKYLKELIFHWRIHINKSDVCCRRAYKWWIFRRKYKYSLVENSTHFPASHDGSVFCATGDLAKALYCLRQTNRAANVTGKEILALQLDR